jgi:hypothetical protein
MSSDDTRRAGKLRTLLGIEAAAAADAVAAKAYDGAKVRVVDLSSGAWLLRVDLGLFLVRHPRTMFALSDDPGTILTDALQRGLPLNGVVEAAVCVVPAARVEDEPRHGATSIRFGLLQYGEEVTDAGTNVHYVEGAFDVAVELASKSVLVTPRARANEFADADEETQLLQAPQKCRDCDAFVAERLRALVHVELRAGPAADPSCRGVHGNGCAGHEWNLVPSTTSETADGVGFDLVLLDQQRLFLLFGNAYPYLADSPRFVSGRRGVLLSLEDVAGGKLDLARAVLHIVELEPQNTQLKAM